MSRSCYNNCVKSRLTFLLILSIFLLAFSIRFLSIWPANTIVGFDQVRDFFEARKILSGDIKIIGPTAGNNENLHHGVAYFYYILLPLLAGKGNPIWIAVWNSFFNAGVAIILFFLAESLFESKKAGFIAAFLGTTSYYLIEYSGWLSNPTPTLLTVPLFFFGLWKYRNKVPWGLYLAALGLGLSIQFELFFIYLIPIGAILWLVLTPKLPSLKISIFSFLTLMATLSTMIATEIKFKFAGIKSLLVAGQTVGGGNVDLGKFLSAFFNTFSYNLWPQKPQSGIVIGLLLITLFILLFQKQKSFKFVLIYLFSPTVVLILGQHNAAWFLIGLPPAIILLTSAVLSRIKKVYVLLPILALIALANLKAVRGAYGKGQPLLGPDASAVLSSQLAVIDYTYQKSGGLPFAINSVTNPLYINALWAYHYDWYGKGEYGYLPDWLGGNQLLPYNTLPTFGGDEKYFFLIIDATPRIPLVHRLEAEKWAKTKGVLVEEKNFGGILVQMYEAKKELPG